MQDPFFNRQITSLWTSDKFLRFQALFLSDHAFDQALDKEMLSIEVELDERFNTWFQSAEATEPKLRTMLEDAFAQHDLAALRLLLQVPDNLLSQEHTYSVLLEGATSLFHYALSTSDEYRQGRCYAVCEMTFDALLCFPRSTAVIPLVEVIGTKAANTQNDDLLLSLFYKAQAALPHSKESVNALVRIRATQHTNSQIDLDGYISGIESHLV